ncbi:hypothetical protein BBH88_12320 [Planococcus antarcticus DSM 14505]|uniref:P-type Cu(+) transporter n=1 Tax=Planococcus antarcticus DSM 14505 TaxID=1185653 RepID=A0ABM6D6M7_9BACL|nr:hypothetical protein BBH88_12320 [Planococcus antarcticus DSM 14505]
MIINLATINYNLMSYSKEGKTVVFVLVEEELAGMFALADMVRETAKGAVAKLKAQGIHTIMLTGDNKKVADRVAKQVGIDKVYAEVLPDDKANQIKKIKEKVGK